MDEKNIALVAVSAIVKIFVEEVEAREIYINDNFFIKLGNKEYKKFKRELENFCYGVSKRGLTIETFYEIQTNKTVIKISKAGGVNES